MTVNQLSNVLNSCRMFVGYWKDQEFIVSVVGCRICVSVCVCICENFSSFITASRLRHCSHLSLPLLFGINCGFLGVSVSTVAVAVAGRQTDRRSRYTDTKILRYFCTLPTACGTQLESVVDCSRHTHTHTDVTYTAIIG